MKGALGEARRNVLCFFASNLCQQTRLNIHILSLQDIQRCCKLVTYFCGSKCVDASKLCEMASLSPDEGVWRVRCEEAWKDCKHNKVKKKKKKDKGGLQLA